MVFKQRQLYGVEISHTLRISTTDHLMLLRLDTYVGSSATWRSLSRSFWFQNALKDIEEYVCKYKVCARAKASHQDYISPEEQLRRLAYCVKFLPSPLYKKERLMPTNPIAQRRCIEEYKAREKRKREERRKELKERRKYLDEEEDEEEEKEEEEKAAKKIKLDIMDLRQKTLKELCAYLDEEEEEEEEKEEKEEKAKKMKLHIKIPRGEVTAKG
ncbi:uncharacterized protein [Phyllobates terribilis]|uniref:uncharacterized protein n=1 Tax=Phyllobates terribilis TaxID=111132 RepID=UPI003CCAE071